MLIFSEQMFPLLYLKVDSLGEYNYNNNYKYIHDNNLFYTFNKIICKRNYADKGYSNIISSVNQRKLKFYKWYTI